VPGTLPGGIWGHLLEEEWRGIENRKGEKKDQKREKKYKK
jgi:hypothetical protein